MSHCLSKWECTTCWRYVQLQTEPGDEWQCLRCGEPMTNLGPVPSPRVEEDDADWRLP